MPFRSLGRSTLTLIGMISGLAVPLGILVFLWLYQIPTVSLWRYWSLMQEWGMLKRQMMLAVIGNMLVFYVFYRLHKNEGARGVVISTLLLSIVTVVLYCR